MNTKAFYKISNEITKIESQLEELNNQINNIRSKAKKLKKGSQERESEMFKANQIQNSLDYISLKSKLSTFQYCYNVMFYN